MARQAGHFWAMLETNRAVYHDKLPLGPGWYACIIKGNRITYVGPLKSEAEALRISKEGTQDA